MATRAMTEAQFKALAQMDPDELGQLGTMALMVLAIKTEADYAGVLRELADTVEEKHGGWEGQEELRGMVEQAMRGDAGDEVEVPDVLPEPAAAQERDVPAGARPPDITYKIVLGPAVWAMPADEVLDLIDRATSDARDQLLTAYEANVAQVRADFPRIVTTTPTEQED